MFSDPISYELTPFHNASCIWLLSIDKMISRGGECRMQEQQWIWNSKKTTSRDHTILTFAERI